ncbi:MAG: lipoprotein signal peptidase [Bacteroidota bacterium]|nr:lipoprotein signal peptidase [Bacteroidota bacterium]
MSKLSKAFLVVILILIIDQVLKIWVKTHLSLGEEIVIFENWFKIHFTENKGMAFGWQLGGNWGKLILTGFRIIAVSGITVFMVHMSKTKYPFIALLSVGFVLAGALGNIIDSVFYGPLFSQSGAHSVAEFLPEGKGYETFLFGSVVDMLYFPMIDSFYPEWVPFKGGERLRFFAPVFNIADSAISVGVALILIFRNKFIPADEQAEELKPETK